VHRPPTEASRVLADNRRTYDRLIEIVRRHAERGDAERVLRSATLAANFGWCAPMGMLSDPELERLVVDAVGNGQRPVVDGRRSTGRVLHVLSEGYGVGGHTRLAWRWMSRDDRVSDVALTNQRQEIPSQLVETVQASGGQLHDLRPAHPDLLGRAVALRSLFDAVDLVVLHVHPYDAVALAAVNLPGTRPPVVLENHSDHAFWLGVGAADVVSNFRTFTRLSTELRGIEVDRLGLLPLPIDVPHSAGHPAELRQRLGIAADAVVAVSVTSAAKVAPTWGRGMAALLGRALAWSPRLTVVLVGFAASGEWAQLAARHPGRVLIIGPVGDPDPWYALADVYLDGYPTRAGTSVLEAALAGKPVLTIEDIPADTLAYTFQADSPGMAGRPRVRKPEQYVTALRRLVDDPGLRAREGALVQRAVEAAHCGKGWNAALEELYAQARNASACDIERHPGRITEGVYATMLAAFMDPKRPMTSFPVEGAARPLGELFDVALQADLFAVLNRELAPTLTVRTALGWEAEPAWTARLLSLAGEHRRLAVSLPFAASDDGSGSTSTALLTSILAGIGQTPDDCGTVAVEVHPPRDVHLSVAGELPCTTEALERLTLLVCSPLWTPLELSSDADDTPGELPRAMPRATLPGPRSASSVSFP
jgi:glycosyltransferase involved in cell wall biosynthesis